MTDDVSLSATAIAALQEFYTVCKQYEDGIIGYNVFIHKNGGIDKMLRYDKTLNKIILNSIAATTWKIRFNVPARNCAHLVCDISNIVFTESVMPYFELINKWLRYRPFSINNEKEQIATMFVNNNDGFVIHLVSYADSHELSRAGMKKLVDGCGLKIDIGDEFHSITQTYIKDSTTLKEYYALNRQ